MTEVGRAVIEEGLTEQLKELGSLLGHNSISQTVCFVLGIHIDAELKAARIYRTGSHCDNNSNSITSRDLVGLYCIGAYRSGITSGLSSALGANGFKRAVYETLGQESAVRWIDTPELHTFVKCWLESHSHKWLMSK